MKGVGIISTIGPPRLGVNHLRRRPAGVLSILALASLALACGAAGDADLTLHGGKIVTADSAFRVTKALPREVTTAGPKAGPQRGEEDRFGPSR